MSQTKVQLLRPDLGDVIDFDSSTLFMDGADNRVGIRNTNPQYELDVTGTVRATNFIGAGSTTIADWIVHDGDTDTKIGFSAADTFQVFAGGGPRLTITNSEATFTKVIKANETGDNKGIRIHTNGGISATANELRFNTGQTNGFTFNSNSDGTSGGERVRITAAGELLVGTTSRLQTYSSSGGTLISSYNAGANGGGIELGGNTNTNGNNAGSIFFVNNTNSNASTINNAASKIVGMLRAEIVTSDSNAGDDSGGDIAFYTKPEAGVVQARLRIGSDSNITQTIDTDGDGFIITAGDMKPMLTGNSNRSAHNNTIFGISGKWNNTEVGRIAFEAGADTTNKDDGHINFYTRVSGGSLTSRFHINSSGNLKIGTASAAGGRLYFESTSGAAQYIASGGTNNQDLIVASSAGEKLRITSGGKVCINNDTALSDLHVCTAGSSEQNGTFRIGGSGGSLGLTLDYDQAGATVSRIMANPSYNNTSALLKICVDGDTYPNQLVLRGDGRVGIGTADNDEVELQVIGSSSNGIIRLGGNSGSGVGLDINYSNSSTTTTTFKQNYRATNAGALMKFDSGHFAFHTGTTGTEHLRINSLGVLQLQQSTNTNQGIEWYSAGGAKSASIGWGNGNANFEFKNFRQDAQADGPYGNVDFFTGSSTNPGLKLRIQVTGEIGTDGVTNPTGKFHIGGTNNFIRLGTATLGGETKAVADYNGNPYLSGTPWYTTGTYSYDTNQSPNMDYYWIKVVDSMGGSAIGYIEYMAHGDSNYPRSVHGFLEVAKYNGGSLSIVHSHQNQSAGTVQCVVDSNEEIWLRFHGFDWNSDVRFRLIYGESVTMNSDFTVGTTSTSCGRMRPSAAEPPNKSYDIVPGVALRWNLSNSNPPKSQYGNTESQTAGTYGLNPSYAHYAHRMGKAQFTGRVHVTANWQEGGMYVTSNGIDVNGASQPICAQFRSQKNTVLEINRMYTQGVLMQFRQNNDARGYINNSGTTTSFVQSGSDERLKKNFEDWTEEVLPHFKALKPKKFNFKEESDDAKKTKGYIAQDNLDKFPEAYPLNPEDDRYWFSNSDMVPYLMKALQEEIIKREEIEAKYNALEARIAALES